MQAMLQLWIVLNANTNEHVFVLKTEQLWAKQFLFRVMGLKEYGFLFKFDLVDYYLTILSWLYQRRQNIGRSKHCGDVNSHMLTSLVVSPD